MARKIDIGVEATQAVPEPVFLITSNGGTVDEVAIQHIYAPMTSTQMTAIGANAPVGSVTYDSTTGALMIHNGTAFVAG